MAQRQVGGQVAPLQPARDRKRMALTIRRRRMWTGASPTAGRLEEVMHQPLLGIAEVGRIATPVGRARPLSSTLAISALYTRGRLLEAAICPLPRDVALCFTRVVSCRDDKSAESADTIDGIRKVPSELTLELSGFESSYPG